MDEKTGTPNTENEKISNTDPSLLLQSAPRINKKIIRLFFAVSAGFFLAAVIIAFSPRKPPRAKDTDVDENGNIIIRKPYALDITEDDYLPPVVETEIPDILEDAPASRQTGDYQTYDRRPEVVIRESPPQPFTVRPESDTRTGQSMNTRDRRAIFYNALPVSLTPIGTDQNQGGEAAQPADAALAAFDRQNAALEGMYASDFQKQNMNAVKQDFLDNARQSRDFSTYLSPMFLPPIDPYHEIKSGTYIPITLISSIHSDLPGPIEAQVLENVYDTYSGNNILLPRGTRVHGEYSSSVAFGQDRVLIVWQKMTLPDGVTVSLQGMQGVDLRGMSGLADKVDYHLDSILYAVGLSTVFDIGKAALVSALSTTKFLSDINAALNAQGSVSSATNEATQTIVTNYANKLLNQQPTIVIREGTRGNVFVSKDIILPRYGIY